MGKKVCEALKYTIAFIFVFAILLALGIILKSGKFENEDKKEGDEWIDNLSGSFNTGDAIVSFCVAVLATLGLFGWIVYTAYGLIAFPVGLMRKKQHDGPDSRARGAKKGAVMSNDNIHLNLRKTDSEIEYLSARYESGNRKWTVADRKQLTKLKNEKRKWENMLKKDEDSEGGCCGGFWVSLWNCLAPFRIVIGIVLMAVSLLIISSLIISSVDKTMHSDCKSSCGYTVKDRMMNPIDETLKLSSKYFPTDYIVFGGIMLYIFLCTLTGLMQLGVRLLIWKLYDVQPGRTMPHGLIMGAWLIMFTVLLLNIQLMTLMPQYATFGDQSYTDPIVCYPRFCLFSFFAPLCVHIVSPSLSLPLSLSL